MPSDLSYWIISAPLKDGDPGIMLMDARNALGDSVEVGQWEIPELKVCFFVITMMSNISRRQSENLDGWWGHLN